MLLSLYIISGHFPCLRMFFIVCSNYRILAAPHFLFIIYLVFFSLFFDIAFLIISSNLWMLSLVLQTSGCVCMTWSFRDITLKEPLLMDPGFRTVQFPLSHRKSTSWQCSPDPDRCFSAGKKTLYGHPTSLSRYESSPTVIGVVMAEVKTLLGPSGLLLDLKPASLYKVRPTASPHSLQTLHDCGRWTFNNKFAVMAPLIFNC